MLAVVAGCAVVVVISLALSVITIVRQSNADAVRSADQKARAVSQVSGCYQQVESVPKVLRILNLIDGLATNSILANQAALKSSPPDDPLVLVRKESLERLIPARADLRTYITQTEKQAPTKTTCLALAKKLGVDRSAITKGTR